MQVDPSQEEAMRASADALSLRCSVEDAFDIASILAGNSKEPGVSAYWEGVALILIERGALVEPPR